MMSRAVATFIKVVLLYTIMSSIRQLGECTSDTIKISQAISVGQNLMSANQKFKLGFFSPSNSSRRYVGIWYKTIPETILWVANRGNPLSASDESARFMLSDDGNLVILDGNQDTVWSTNISVRLSHPVAVLLETGDLVINDYNTLGSGKVAWRSFAHPSDVYVMTSQLEISTKIGDKLIKWSCWRSENDPAIGHFSGVLFPQSPVQMVVSHGEAIYWTSGPWNGLRFVGMQGLSADYLDNWSVRQNQEKGVLYFGVNQYNPSTTKIMKLFPQGSLKKMERVGNDWNVVWETPISPCDVYGMCGPFGVCKPNKSPICTCPRGFLPKSVEEWSKGNWSNGCVRRTQLLCSKNMTLAQGRNYDGFWKLTRMKIPNNYQYLSSGEKNTQGCLEGCLRNCSCTAYAYVDGIGCLVWKGDLIDMQEFSLSGEDVFVRLDHSELVKSKKIIIIISLVSALFFIIFCFFITFVAHKVRNKQHKQRKGISKLFFPGTSSDVQQLLNWKSILQDELTTFDFEDIVTATNDFSHLNKVGEGGFGEVFRGKLHDGQEIAVKRLSRRSGQGLNEFLNEILLISKLQHRNLVKIIGCSIEGEEKLIVYEYLPNGSLDAFLFDSSKKNKLDWNTRFNIIQAIARGISYLHRDSRLKVIHRDLKASNVLLDNDMNPKISDFGLARTFQATQESDNTRRVVGT